MQTTLQATLNRLMSPVRSLAAGRWVALLCALSLCLFALPANAGASPTPPIVVTGTPVQLGALTSGGWDGSQEPVGGTFVVGLNGNVLVGTGYGSNYLQLTLAGSDTTLAAGVGGSAATLDKYGNLYFGGNYNANIYKVPYNASTGTYVGWTGSAPTAACLGGTQDTAPCVFAPAIATYVGTLGGSGFAGVAFDAAGNFFFETNTLPTTNANTIFECNTSCISNPSATPTVLYQDANPIGAMEMDPWGNIFFVDGNNAKGKATNLNELKLSSGAYATTPVVVLSYTNEAGYSNGISGLAISGTGTVYFTTNGDGIFAIPNTQSGGPSVSGMYMVSAQGGKGLAIDSAGNLYGIPYNGGDVVSYIPVNNFAMGSDAVGTAATAVSATIFDSSAPCTPTVAATALQFGVTSTEFTAAAGTTCSTAFGGTNGTFSTGPLTAAGFSSFPVTLNFTPVAAGSRTAALVLTDSTSGASGMTALNGVGQAPAANIDPGVSTAYSTGLTKPASIVSDPSGDVFIADSSAGKVYEIANGTTTPTAIGSGFMTPDALAFDANGDLFVGDDGLLTVVEIANTGTKGAFAAGTQTTVIGTSTLFGGKALASATGMAVGPRGTLYISDPANNRVVYFNPILNQAGVTLANTSFGITTPMGLAVDSSSNLYVADSGTNKIVEFLAAGGIATIAPPNVTQAVGVAVDGSGSLLVSDAGTGNIVRIPNESGTLTLADAVTVETLASPSSSLWADAAGDLYVTSGNSAFAIQRSAAAINLGTVQNGLTNSGTVYLMNSGNAAATLASLVVTQPANTMFTLNPASTNGCKASSSGPAGSACQLVATFAPLVGTANGVQTGTATVNVAAPALALNVTMTGTASQSSIVAQKITGFAPTTPILVGQQMALTASGGASGNPVVFTIDPASSCTNCATITGNTLTAVAAGKIIVDANQAGGSSSGQQYAAAPQVTAAITINSATPTGVPGLVMNQVTWLNPTGSFTDGQNPMGGSFAVTQNGEIVVGTTYSNKVYIVNAQTGATISTTTFNGPGGMTVDSSNNLYISHLYNSIIYKIPYVKGAYVTWSDNPTPAPPACTGSDTAECTFASSGQNTKAIAFDPSGNFYMVSEPSSTDTSGSSAIYECGSGCLPAGTGTLLYSDTNGISQIAFDPSGNLFFTDSNYNEAGTNNEANSGASSSNLKELVYTSGTGFAATPKPLQTFTNTGTPGGYDDTLASVTVNPSGTIYYGVLYDGTFAIPEVAGVPQVASQFAVSSQGAKALTADSLGNLYMVANTSGADTVGFLAINNMAAGTGPVLGTPVTASATVVDNAIGCGTAATLVFTSNNPTNFQASARTTCTSIGMGDATLLNAVPAISSYPATITFSPQAGGPLTATLAISDTANGGTGTANVTGTGQEIAQTITFTAPLVTTYTYSPTLTVQLGATGGASNNTIVFTVDKTSTGAGTISSSGLLTVTQAGSIVIDANQAGGLVNNVYYQNATQAQLTLTVNQAAQTIVFPAPGGAPFTYTPTLTVALSANGGASGNAVAFTVDASSTGAGTISASTLSNGTSSATLTVTTAGSFTIDANQTGTTNYAVATQVQQTFTVNPASQSIAFIPPTQPIHFVTGGTLQFSVSATGGGSDGAITFSVDKTSAVKGTFSASTVSGATSTAVLTVTQPSNLTASSPILIDANQAATSNYAAAPQQQETIALQPALPTQTITWSNPGTQVTGTPLTLTATASSGFPVVYTSSTTSVCTVTSTTATFLAAGTCTVTASQPGDNTYFAAAPSVTQTFTVNPTGQVPSIGLNLSLTSLTIQPGTVGLSNITLNSVNNFTGPVTFSCSGLPTGYTCTFNPAGSSANPLVVPEGGSATTALSVGSSGTAELHQSPRPFVPVATLAFALCLIGFRKKRNRLFLMLLIAFSLTSLGLFTGCTGSSSTSSTQATSSTATLTATSGKMTSSTTFTVIVE